MNHEQPRPARDANKRPSKDTVIIITQEKNYQYNTDRTERGFVWSISQGQESGVKANAPAHVTASVIGHAHEACDWQ